MVRIHTKMASSSQATYPKCKDAAALCTKVQTDLAKIIYLGFFYTPLELGLYVFYSILWMQDL